MSRELRRVPLDFDWPLNTPWWGYRIHVELPPCPADCEGGWSPAAREHRKAFYASDAWSLDRDWYRTVKAELGEDAMTCPRCHGSGSAAPESLHEAADAFVAQHRVDPPVGEGWQMWETVSEGSPISPVFATANELVEWMVTPDPAIKWMGHPYSRAAAERFVEVGWSLGSMMSGPRGLVDGVEALVVHGQASDEAKS